jgi:hypothetical protein
MRPYECEIMQISVELYRFIRSPIYKAELRSMYMCPNESGQCLKICWLIKMYSYCFIELISHLGLDLPQGPQVELAAQLEFLRSK